MTAGFLDLRSEIAALETRDLVDQAALLTGLPHELRQLAAPRLAMLIVELSDRAVRS
ncbi:hypothetical protein [Nitrolancea hollandica]|uniref:Uncharacterized protein n=1 Tax=Nitrolancea hollandica Lb TaxID=1129897 RepID=I4EHH4_9BACT|nr:hypothetical protein [Nitrolancea hollandica]CCF84136.1 hypothetical protein NITHO_3110009 [Nitrolancea hollandica Lb]